MLRAFLPQVEVELVKKSTFQLGYDGSALTQAQLQAIVEESACGSPVSAGCSATLTLRPQRRRALSGTPTYDVQVQQQMSGSDSVQADVGAANATVANIASSIQAQDSSAQVVAEVQAVSTEADVVITQEGDGTAATDLQTDLVNIDAGPGFSVDDLSLIHI